MLELDARAFYAASNALQHLLTAIEAKQSVFGNDDGGVSITFVDDKIFIQSLRRTSEQLVSVRWDVESNESFMIPWCGLILEGVADVDERKSCSLRP